MKIAFVAPLIGPLKEPHIGGAQVFLCSLAQELQNRGHTVTMYAAHGSLIHKLAIQTYPCAPKEIHIKPNLNGMISFKKDKYYQEQAQTFKKIYQDISKEGYDIVHNHALDPPSFEESFKYSLPIVHTLHTGNCIPQTTQILKKEFLKTGRTGTIAISKTVALSYQTHFPLEATIVNGVNLKQISLGDGGGNFLFFAGRICPEKGVKEAILIALKAGKNLQIAGPIHFPDYFNTEIHPLIEAYPKQIIYLGHLGPSQIQEKMQKAEAVLVTSLWEEPFGLVAAEAQAAGCPVIAFKVGALPEIIEHEKTGFLVEKGEINMAAFFLKQIHFINRKACRQRMKDYFNFERMVEEYERFYITKLN